MSTTSLRDAQLAMAAHLRDPEGAPAPAGIEERRLQVYRELIYNNIEGFISGGFPVLRSLYPQPEWDQLVRMFMDTHRCKSPYFLEISQEFISYLLNEHQLRECDPPFMAELAHYEWVELALDIAEDELPAPADTIDLETCCPRLSPLAWVLSYQFPVHRVGAGYRPQTADQPTYLVVYRNHRDEVEFIELNAATARLLELIRDNDSASSVEILSALAREMQMPAAQIHSFGLQQLGQMLQSGVLVAS
ncbi:DUF2063 domain-containing protein [Seongchinamella sediminis]|uniref:DUF2063 domain-containing protein n=1 Tax=Seongchinamella sediminis TaxID=2283635 RepID=A0A3L7E319_9GAMM|nr:putative DNA-binding domain-containing protein [Seongchinamella sediminis]RLQ23210.1 DUF2063 domain-containing protein [Seongchinamella sediminis]